MVSGGSRLRSGPAKDPNSGRSDRLGFSATALPSEGFTGEVPDFPLPQVELYKTVIADGAMVKEFDSEATAARFYRELDLWAWAWSTPQAAMWAREPWRHYAVAMWVRTAAVCESVEAQAADKNSLHRFADQIGLTPAGLAGNGWSIAQDQVQEKRDEKVADAVPDGKAAPVRRLRSVNGGG